MAIQALAQWLEALCFHLAMHKLLARQLQELWQGLRGMWQD
jgi:hypothetical protein